MSTAVCTLCDGEAAIFSTPNFGRYKAMECGKCGRFVMSDSAHDRIIGLPDQLKDALRGMINSAPPEKILLVIITPVGSGSEIKPELVLRSTLRL